MSLKLKLIRKLKRMLPRALVNFYFLNLVIISFLSIYLIVHLNIILDDLIVQSENNKNCPIIDLNKKQFRVNLNGQTYPKHIALYHNTSINFKCLNSSAKSSKTILMWTKFFGLPFRQYKFESISLFESLNCPVTNCVLTQDRSKLSKSDLVLFHLRNKIDYFPKRAYSSQRFVHVIYESPISCHLCDKFENQFNLSATYTLDSDFTSIYYTDSGMRWEYNEMFKEYDVHATKSQFASALISNCPDRSGRLEYIKRVSQYVPVEIYGNCGSKKCLDQARCREYLARNFKFYFAFENSICRDYITEKFFETLEFDVVPIIMSYSSHKEYVPKSAFINIFDFKSPKHLAEYLIYLDKNKTAYNEYFEWKRYVKFDTKKILSGFLCEMCIQLHLEDKGVVQVRNKELKNLSKRFGLSENCKQPYYDNFGNFFIAKLSTINYTYMMSYEK